jgi:glutamate N-acetyltransferase/amino-acid N-acetyltransferase
MMKAENGFQNDGTVTSPQGFLAGATYAGMKTEKDSLDLGVLFSEAPCNAAGVFTTNRIKAAPVLLCQDRMKSGRARTVVINSGFANACTGEAGLQAAAEMANLTAAKTGVSPEEVLVASTGVIGLPVPLDKVRNGLTKLAISPDGGHELARAMMTTDTVPKETAVKIKTAGGEFTIGGVTKGSGMIHPNMGTMLCFLTTDAALELEFMRTALKEAVDKSFNMITVDGDTSTNDTVLLLANGLAGNKAIGQTSPESGAFREALEAVAINLARKMAADGEGASKMIEVTVSGAPDLGAARLVARTVVGSSLVKTAVYGNDPNWGRIIAATGRSGVPVVESKIDLDIGDIPVLRGGRSQPFAKEPIVAVLKQKEVPIRLDLHMGTAEATAWGCDMTEQYIVVNSYYTT